jgi:predicted nucleic-acid-binding Zn-ribbon protein
METMSSEEKQKIIDILSKKGANRPCPRCNEKNFTLLDGYFNQSIQQMLTPNLIIGGPSVPSIVVVCNNCGYMSQHALGVLGLLSKVEEKK